MIEPVRPTKVSAPPLLPASDAEAAVASNSAEYSGSAGATKASHETDSKLASTDVARLLGARDSSGDRMEVSVDEKDGVVVRIVDQTGEVVRQIPPDELVALARRLDQAIGVLFDKKA